ncbi:hypothetical protein WR25_11448 [Diploscapter pachys]|uniref:Uncharacterized protein n=1 Tax=Diploscapter pachys TaxID=2018661 RepID=A0A2A2J688_9BILA|nr:hypothetical protein WR25_11448 [Diploscapter pachys]
MRAFAYLPRLLRNCSTSSSSCPTPLHLVLYTASACSLCGRFKADLSRFLQQPERTHISVQEVDISTAPREIFERRGNPTEAPLRRQPHDQDPRGMGSRTGVIAVHGGVSFNPSTSLHSTCQEALLSSDKPDLIGAIKFLENCPNFNCGTGSNLTMHGRIECDASFMSSDELRYGAVSCVSRLKNPCEVAKSIAEDTSLSAISMVQPMTLVGFGAHQWAKERGFDLIEEDELISKKAKQMHEQGLNYLDSSMQPSTSAQLDTVGGLASDTNGSSLEVVSSSGGLFMKPDGRLGSSATFGASCWAEKRHDLTVGITVSGCGEALIRTNFARSLAEAIFSSDDDALPADVLRSWFDNSFLCSPLLTRMQPHNRLAGGLVFFSSPYTAELISFHNTPSLPFAYFSKNKCKSYLSVSPSSDRVTINSFILK